MKASACALLLALVSCSEKEPQKQAEQPRGCYETATVIGTAAGSSSEAGCPHKTHVMEVSLSPPSGNNVSALVVCRCRADGGTQ